MQNHEGNRARRGNRARFGSSPCELAVAKCTHFWLPMLVRVVPAAVQPPRAASFAGLSDAGR